MADTIADLLRSITSLWLNQVELCTKARQRDFGTVADEVERYIGKHYDRVVVTVDDQIIEPIGEKDSATIVNYTQLFVDTMTPYAFARVPNRLVQPDRPQIPPELENEVPEITLMQQGRRKRDTMLSYELQSVLQWLPRIYNLTREGEIAVREAFTSGRGILLLEMIDGPTGEIPASFAISNKNLLIDADCRQLRDAAFIMVKCEDVAWKVAEEYGEDVKLIRANAASNMAIAAGKVNNEPEKSDQSDICTFYRIWSVMGMGHKLVGAPNELSEPGQLRDLLDTLGPYVHFAVMDGMDHPLGMDPKKLEAIVDPAQMLTLLKEMLRWPIETYGNVDNPWPLRCLDLRPQVQSPWPRPVLEDGLPLQRFIDDIYQSLLQRAKKAGRDIIITSLALDESVKDAIRGFEDLPIVPVGEPSTRALKELIDFIQFPELNKNLFEILQLADSAFRELTGLDPSLAGSTPRTQERSAKASKMRDAGLSRRPDEYADKVEAFMSEQAQLEGIALRLMTTPETIAPVFGEPVIDLDSGENATPETINPYYGPLTQFWATDVHTDDPWVAGSECEYTVEAGSGRRRNKQLQQENVQQIYTMLGQQVFALGTALNDMEPYLALVRMVAEAYEAPIEPVITKVREALAKLGMAQGQQPMPGEEGQVPPQGQQPGSPEPMEGATALPLQWMGAAGGPRKLNLPPPPGTV